MSAVDPLIVALCRAAHSTLVVVCHCHQHPRELGTLSYQLTPASWSYGASRNCIFSWCQVILEYSGLIICYMHWV